MSLLSNKQVRLALRPGAIEASLWRGRLRAVKLTEHAVHTDIAALDSDAQTQAIDELFTALAQQAPIKGASLSVELTDAMVHFDVATGNFAGKSARQLHSFAAACIVELLGERAAAHTVRWHLQQDERHLLVCAMQSSLLNALTVAAQTHRLRLGSIRPSFAVQWNRYGSGSLSDDAVFAVTAGMNAMIAFVRTGVVTAVSNGWTERDEITERDSDVPRLMAGVGVANSAGRALDLRVDQLLASLGLDGAGTANFLLVSADDAQVFVSKRWTILAPSGADA